MFFKNIESKGLAHYSYMVGDQGSAAIIDPRRDIDEYLNIAREEGLKITHIFETHRNEDYIVGSIELAEKTGAKIYISGHEDVGHVYGEKIYDGDEFEIGNLKIKAIHTPGHTLGHMCYVLYENGRTKPYFVFTGDTLFIGDLGRTDFYGKDNLEKMTGLLYDSVFEKLFKLDDETMIFPAHGAGSACGDDMEDRRYSTIGYEKKYNGELQVSSKEEFIEKFASMRIKPKYFEDMEAFNVKGAPPIQGRVLPNPMTLEDVKENGANLLDLRPKEAYFGGHIPNSYHMGIDTLSTFLGNLFDIDTKFALVLDNPSNEMLEEIQNQCFRIGFDNIEGFLVDDVDSYIMKGRTLETMNPIPAKEFLELGDGDDYVLLDVRKDEERNEDFTIKNAIHIPLQLLSRNYEKVPKDKKIYTLCASGKRAAIAASYLKNQGYDTDIVIGGMLGLSKAVKDKKANK